MENRELTFKFLIEIDTDSDIDLVQSEMENWLNDMQFNQIDAITQKNLIYGYDLRQQDDNEECDCEDNEPQHDWNDLD